MAQYSRKDSYINIDEEEVERIEKEETKKRDLANVSFESAKNYGQNSSQY